MRMKHNKRYFHASLLQKGLLSLLLALWIQPAFAIELADNIQVHGFLTQGAFYTSDNNYNGDSDDDVSFDQTEIGLNAFWQVNDRVDFSVQGLYRKAGKVENGDVRLDYGMMNVNLFNDENNHFGLRLGRIKNPIGLYNETRDVAFTTPSILLPQSIYLERSRSLLVASDGGQLFSKHQLGDGWLSIKLNYGNTHNDNDEVRDQMFVSYAHGDLDSEDGSFVGQIKYNFQSDKYIFALSYADVTLEYDSSSRDLIPFADGTARFAPYIFSAQYNGEKLSLTTEYYYSENEFKDFGAYSPDLSPITTNWYVQGEYRLSHKWQAIMRYDESYLDKDDRSGKNYEAMGAPGHMGFTKDSMIGVRWDIRPDVMLRAEYHNINGTSWLPSADNPARNDTKRYWDLFSLQMSYRF